MYWQINWRTRSSAESRTRKSTSARGHFALRLRAHRQLPRHRYELFRVPRPPQKGQKGAPRLFVDEFDRLRKVPKNVSDYLGNNSFEQYIGYP